MADSTANKNPIRIPNELLRELKLAQIEEWQRSETTPSYGELLVAAWNKAKERPTAPAPLQPPASKHQPWIEKLVTILEHGTDLDKIGIQSNLDAFCAKITLENLPRRKRASGE